jgi:hypothetical protein
MVQSLSNLVRLFHRGVQELDRRTDVSRSKKAPGTDLKLASAKPQTGTEKLSRTGDADEYAAVINFELVPSGRIAMNREAREHIVDFFQ